MLTIDGLRVSYRGASAPVEAVAGLSLAVAPGCALALVGESGSGKSTVVTAVLGLLPKTAEVGGTVTVDGVNVFRASGAVLTRLRGSRVGFVGQQSFAAFDPLFAVDAQLEEAWRAHAPGGGGEARAAALAAAGLDLSGLAAGQPPHRLSGGMLQRAQVAAAMLHRPPLLIADEPTSALDPLLARRLAIALRALRDGGTALLIATHDLGLAARVADEVVVMRAGRVVERGPVASVFAGPREAYTAALLAAHPSRGLHVTDETALRDGSALGRAGDS